MSQISTDIHVQVYNVRLFLCRYCLVKNLCNNELYICGKEFVDQLHSILAGKSKIIQEIKGTVIKEIGLEASCFIDNRHYSGCILVCI